MSKITDQQRAYADKLENDLKNSMRPITLGDASSAIGISMRDAKDVLDYLIEKYDCRLKITENADLIYDFGRNFHRRGERTWQEWQYEVEKWLWKAFMIFFKLWITITLVVYFIIFLVILIVLIVAMFVSASSATDSDVDIDVKGCGGFFHIFGELIHDLFVWNTVQNTYHYETDANGYRYKAYDSRPSTFDKLRKKPKDNNKGFVASVYDFVFGPPRVEFNPLENEQEVAAFLRQNKGVIVKAELIALAGWTAEQAEGFFSEILVKFEGQSAISPNKILYGDFYDLTRSKSQESDAEVIYYWNEFEPEYKLTGNTWGRNAGIIFLNAFNLVFALLFTADALSSGEPLFSDNLAIAIGLGWIPLTFSLIFFGVPILRSIQLVKKRHQRRLENIRKRLLRVIFQRYTQTIPLKQMVELVNQGATEEKLSQTEVQAMMQKVLRDLDGEIDIDSNAEVIYHFPTLAAEMQEVKALRKERDSGKELGNILLDSHD